MSETNPKLFLFFGKPASVKSTLAKKLGQVDGTVVVAEDEWLAALFGDELVAISDYVRCSKKLCDIMGSHIVSLLKAGTSVVLDYPANTPTACAWIGGIARSAGVIGEFHYFDLPDEVCKARPRERNQSGRHPFQLSEEQFDRLSSHFTAPTDEEGFLVIVQGPN
ncbi:AAA family ATPase [Ruegeria atlantica]|uniref:Putative kinase n=1 Tax=Ruegeria atlantica TaxID=81569 RepID=A0A0P1E7A3_9RHOB|nr:ATP-binding protein [Ruegeria atlantica]CUH44811.1 putative kinase [Ruegeria atlantica]